MFTHQLAIAYRADRLFEMANAAAADAIRYRRDPNGGPMARLRAQDAKALRRLARATAQALQDSGPLLP